MRYAVSVKTGAGQSGWLGIKRGNSRAIVVRQQDASIFGSHEEAEQAILEMPSEFAAAGVHFAIDPLDTAARIDCENPPPSG